MSDSALHRPRIDIAEQLLAALPGVVSARVVAGLGDRLEEIHILATSDLHPKQIVRNVESALSAGLGIEVNRRIVSVAQVREGMAEALAAAEGKAAGSTAAGEPAGSTGIAQPAGLAAGPTAEPPAPTVADGPVAHHALPESTPTAHHAPPESAPGAVAAEARQEHPNGSRIVYLGHEINVDADRVATCTVSLGAGTAEYSGQGSGFDNAQGRAEAAAQATIEALHDTAAADRFGLEGVAIVDTPGRECVLVSVRPLAARRRSSLTGTASLEDSPEMAAIMAVLQATNHWRGR